MPSCSRARNKRGVEILFEEETHTYSSVIGESVINYVSGTTFVGSFFPKFDPTGEITRRCARREGITEDEMRERWKEKADRSCLYGTKIHECMEDHILGRKLRNTPSDDREKIVFSVAERLAGKILGRSEILGVEKILFDERLKIAGTMDLLIRSKKDGSVWICDYKTNEKIETENRYRSFGLPPIEDVPNTNYYHYNEQLSLYKKLLLEGGYVDGDTPVKMTLFHITEKGCKPYVLEDRTDDIEKMFKTYRDRGFSIIGS